jgi:hypothetical protein
MNRAELIRLIDRRHSKLIIKRDKACITCGAEDGLTCSHLFGRARMSTRWDTESDGNCHCQCMTCNQRHSDVGTSEYVEWYVKRFGETAFNRLRLRANGHRKYMTYQLAELLEVL